MKIPKLRKEQLEPGYQPPLEEGALGTDYVVKKGSDGVFRKVPIDEPEDRKGFFKAVKPRTGDPGSIKRLADRGDQPAGSYFGDRVSVNRAGGPSNSVEHKRTGAVKAIPQDHRFGVSSRATDPKKGMV